MDPVNVMELNVRANVSVIFLPRIFFSLILKRIFCNRIFISFVLINISCWKLNFFFINLQMHARTLHRLDLVFFFCSGVRGRNPVFVLARSLSLKLKSNCSPLPPLLPAFQRQLKIITKICVMQIYIC